MSWLKAVWQAVMLIRWSVLAMVMGIALTFLSLGALGLALYYPVSPVLELHYPDIDTWHGDWVWPSMLMAGMLWSFGFLPAGWLNHWLHTRARLGRWWRRLVYLGVLWLGALLAWWLILAMPPP